MAIKRLDHYSIRTADVDTTRSFYEGVLGLQVGPRPNFPFPGVWLYQGEVAVVHVIGTQTDNAGLQGYLGDRNGHDGAQTAGTGAIDHVAFLGDDIGAMRDHLGANGISFTERKVPNLNLDQIFIRDPNGITVELNFPY